jgi:dTDP-4-dehydrorhamnose reductase
MILLLGARGYVGEAFARALSARGWDFRGLSRAETDYTRFDVLVDLLKRDRPDFLINAAGFTGKPNVDACETARAETLLGNTLLPLSVAHACQAAGVSWGQVSSGCVYSGARVLDEAGGERIEPDLTRPDLKVLLETQPEQFRGFRETDRPNFSFRSPPCSFYSGTKALAEEALGNGERGSFYLWRLRIPFDEFDGPKNYLTKLMRYPKLYENANSISHRGDFVNACLDLWAGRAPFGVYNITNPGFVTTRQVARLLQETVCPGRMFEFWESDEEFYRVAAKTPRSNCLLDTTKLRQAGVSIRPVIEALRDALARWVPGA